MGVTMNVIEVGEKKQRAVIRYGRSYFFFFDKHLYVVARKAGVYIMPRNHTRLCYLTFAPDNSFRLMLQCISK